MSKNALAPHPEAESLLAQIDNDSESLLLTIGGFDIGFTSLNKVMWPGADGNGLTKRDYLGYLLKVAPYILPHLKDRPLTLIRYPNGIDGQKFYQKHWDKKTPPYVETVRFFSEHTDKDNDYLLCNNLATLAWLAQIADLELHTAHSRIDPQPDGLALPMTFTGSVENIEQSLINYPDFLVLDLDPYLYSGTELQGEEPALHKAGFEKTCEIALALKEILESVGITSMVKTSGRTGLHIFVPILRNTDYDTVRATAQAVGQYLLAKRPTEVTMEWSVSKRTGKVFFDHNMNGRGKTLASIYSPRKSPEAPVSMPLRWDELDTVYPSDFTIETAMNRLNEVGDLWSEILDHKNDLQRLTKAIVPSGVSASSDTKLKKRSPRRWPKKK